MWLPGLKPAFITDLYAALKRRSSTVRRAVAARLKSCSSRTVLAASLKRCPDTNRAFFSSPLRPQGIRGSWNPTLRLRLGQARSQMTRRMGTRVIRGSSVDFRRPYRTRFSSSGGFPASELAGYFQEPLWGLFLVSYLLGQMARRMRTKTRIKIKGDGQECPSHTKAGAKPTSRATDRACPELVEGSVRPT